MLNKVIRNLVTIFENNFVGFEQISVNQGTDSRFVLESCLKSVQPRSSRSSILKTQNGIQSKHKYHCSYTNTDASLFGFFVKAEF